MSDADTPTAIDPTSRPAPSLLDAISDLKRAMLRLGLDAPIAITLAEDHDERKGSESAAQLQREGAASKGGLSDLVAVPRDIARAALTNEMSAISEECWAAGWMSGTEDALWQLIRGTATSRTWQADEGSLERLRVLSAALAEWPNPNGDGWIAISVMEKRHAR